MVDKIVKAFFIAILSFENKSVSTPHEVLEKIVNLSIQFADSMTAIPPPFPGLCIYIIHCSAQKLSKLIFLTLNLKYII